MSNIILNKPQHIVSLATSSILIGVDVDVWTATKSDRNIGAKVSSDAGATRNVVRASHDLFAGDPDLKALHNYRQTVYNWLARRSYDWAGSYRCLPIIDLPKVKSEYNEHEDNFYKLRSTFVKKYPSLVSDMAFVRGSMFNAADYPSVEKVESKFNMRLLTSEIPTGDYRCSISDDLAEDLFNHYSRQANETISRIISKQVTQLVTVMESISHCCEIEITQQPDGSVKQKRRKLYDSTITRALELCDTFKDFNLTNNDVLEEARRGLSNALYGISTEQLRDSDSLRDQVKTSVDDILSKFRPAAQPYIIDEE